MSDPVAFGTARLDEDERRAEAMGHFTVDEDEFYSCPAARTEPLGDLEWGEENCQCELAGRKARALREVAAKRRLIEEFAARSSQGVAEIYLATLAAVYSDHPDYDQEWKL